MIVAAVLGVAFLVPAASAEEVYFVQPAGQLQLLEGTLPERSPTASNALRARRAAMLPYAALDGPGQAYVVMPQSGNLADAQVAVRAPAGQDVTGMLCLPLADGSGMQRVRFTIPAAEGSEQRRPDFLTVKRDHYQRLLNSQLSGAAWFRHQVRQTNRDLGVSQETRPASQRRFFGTQRGSTMDDTYALVSGGRAVSENLQLDRALPRSARAVEQVAVADIEGIRVQAFDWQQLLGEQPQPQLDLLAASIPHDQHALFFPSFTSLIRVIDHLDQHGTTLLRWGETRAEDAGTRQRYQQQLCLELGQAERLLGPQLIASVALTGGDPYFRTGTDVALLLETSNGESLLKIMQARLATAGQVHPTAQVVTGELHGIAYQGLRTWDRQISCYLARLDRVVVVSNSPVQLERIIQAHQGALTPLAALDEYKFFRQRYPRQDSQESAFMVLSDDTIRRWCGPRWRIATSRRTRAAAVMSELQATYLSQLVQGDVQATEVVPEHQVPGLELCTITEGGIASPTYGTLTYQTPISELDLEYATQDEAQSYERWRDGYERNWSRFFDPIAARFVVQDDRLAMDLTVMPLIENSDYREWMQLSQNERLDAQDGDPHDGTLLHWVLAISPDSPLLREATDFPPLRPLGANPFAWVGRHLTFYLDQDPYWQDLVEAENPERFIEANLHRLPLAVQIESQSGFRLAAFMSGVRAFIENSAPGMLTWENRTHEEHPYVRVAVSERGRARMGLDQIAIYYATTGKALLLSLNESVLQQALLRQQLPGRPDPTEVAAHSAPVWDGRSMGLVVDGQMLQILEAIWQQAAVLQARSWANLAILNEWKRRFPDQNPLVLHDQFWQRQLVCPGGGVYRWNEQWQTMESSVYGHPGEPKNGPSVASLLGEGTRLRASWTFEPDGLRTYVEWQAPNATRP